MLLLRLTTAGLHYVTVSFTCPQTIYNCHKLELYNSRPKVYQENNAPNSNTASITHDLLDMRYKNMYSPEELSFLNNEDIALGVHI